MHYKTYSFLNNKLIIFVLKALYLIQGCSNNRHCLFNNLEANGTDTNETYIEYILNSSRMVSSRNFSNYGSQISLTSYQAIICKIYVSASGGTQNGNGKRALADLALGQGIKSKQQLNNKSYKSNDFHFFH